MIGHEPQHSMLQLLFSTSLQVFQSPIIQHLMLKDSRKVDVQLQLINVFDFVLLISPTAKVPHHLAQSYQALVLDLPLRMLLDRRMVPILSHSLSLLFLVSRLTPAYQLLLDRV